MTVKITTPYIKLDALLKLAGLCRSGGEAKNAVTGGKVRVGGELCLMRGKKLYPGDSAEFGGETITVAAS
jgi:ribosome-associated protein